jgi:transposase
MERMVGIDVAETELVVALEPGAQLTRWANDDAGRAALAAHLTALAPTLIVLEGSGGVEQAVAAALQEAALPVVVANPAQVRHFAKGLGKLAKTDPIDAAVLARFAAVVRPALRPRPDAASRALRALVARRRQVRDLRVAEGNRQRRADPLVQPSIARVIASLTAELTELEAAIATHLTLDPAWRAKRAVLESVPGVGPVVSATLLAEVPELGACSAKEIAALVGVAPRTTQSGRREGPATIGGGRRSARCALYLATITAVRCNPIIKPFYDGLLARHKPRKLALIAAEHKLLTILNAMLRDGVRWQPRAAMT